MKLLTTILISVLLGTNLAACANPKAASPVAPPAATPASAEHALVGEYQYAGLDEKGVKIIEGRITIASVEPRRIGSETQMQIKGSWELKEVVHRDHIGEQAGTGQLIGSIINGEVILDLNPNTSDANVYLKGKLAGNRLAGTWSFNGYAGPVSHGTFEAVRK